MSFVYFIQAGSNGAIKIGFTEDQDINKRLIQLQTGNPEKLNVLKLIKGTKATEKKLHKLFKEYRLYGEWFAPNRDLYNFIYNDDTYNSIKLSDIKINYFKENKNESVELFLKDNIDIDLNSYEFCNDIYNLYLNYCKNNNIFAISRMVFGTHIKPLVITKKQKRVNGIVKWAFFGIKLKTA